MKKARPHPFAYFVNPKTRTTCNKIQDVGENVEWNDIAKINYSGPIGKWIGNKWTCMIRVGTISTRSALLLRS